MVTELHVGSYCDGRGTPCYTWWLCEERSRVWSHSVVEHLLCEVMCLGVRDGAAETLLTGVKVVPETMYLGKSSIGGDIAHIGDWFVFSCVYYIIRFIGISSSTTRRSTAYCRPRRQTETAREHFSYVIRRRSRTLENRNGNGAA